MSGPLFQPSAQRGRAKSALADPIGYAIGEAEAPFPENEFVRGTWERELKAAFAPHRWLFPRIDIGQSDGQFHSRIFVRFQDDPFAAIERVAAGWRLVVNEPNAAMVFGTVAGMVAWLLRKCGGP